MRSFNQIIKSMKERDQAIKQTIARPTLATPITLTILLTLITLITLTITAQANITENTTITISSNEITCITTTIYTNNDSKDLQTDIDMQGDNNSYINAWEIIKYEKIQQKQIKTQKTPWIIENATTQKTTTTHIISQTALGWINATRNITTTIEITTTYTPENRTEITIKNPNNTTTILIKEEIKIERITPPNNYQQIKPQNNTTTILQLITQNKTQKITTNQTNTDHEFIKTNRKAAEIEEVEANQKERKTALLIATSIFIAITTLLIIIYKKL